jgi:hypothetical protein
MSENRQKHYSRGERQAKKDAALRSLNAFISAISILTIIIQSLHSIYAKAVVVSQ